MNKYFTDLRRVVVAGLVVLCGFVAYACEDEFDPGPPNYITRANTTAYMYYYVYDRPDSTVLRYHYQADVYSETGTYLYSDLDTVMAVGDIINFYNYYPQYYDSTIHLTIMPKGHDYWEPTDMVLAYYFRVRMDETGEFGFYVKEYESSPSAHGSFMIKTKAELGRD